MKYLFQRLALSIAALLLFAPCATARNTKQQQKDSLRQAIARTLGDERKLARNELMRLYLGEVYKEGALDTVLTICDALEADARQAGDTAGEGSPD